MTVRWSKPPPPCDVEGSGGNHVEQMDGTCALCGELVGPKQRQPDKPVLDDLDQAYIQHWDPDGLP